MGCHASIVCVADVVMLFGPLSLLLPLFSSLPSLPQSLRIQYVQDFGDESCCLEKGAGWRSDDEKGMRRTRREKRGERERSEDATRRHSKGRAATDLTPEVIVSRVGYVVYCTALRRSIIPGRYVGQGIFSPVNTDIRYKYR
ncbi:hypothetical protein B0T17DRAFT_260104 [Bombardia bombarda]|uniref:Uncharacterized protein n=1 Tax=Bombardia bombarda TaxID=252184 RepID=A0AA39X1C5_9PEZI|nr:hypothetical protein B0T17DRAFT_260104 [Bombardia bombarda]